MGVGILYKCWYLGGNCCRLHPRVTYYIHLSVAVIEKDGDGMVVHRVVMVVNGRGIGPYHPHFTSFRSELQQYDP